ncbi:MAG TPA: hypothetical protein VJ044_05190 [Candidatus Hodarchaeales archaeon]|nr:hypothetical protein [Candidatus Hodarchaeales archaeon]
MPATEAYFTVKHLEKVQVFDGVIAHNISMNLSSVSNEMSPEAGVVIFSDE